MPISGTLHIVNLTPVILKLFEAYIQDGSEMILGGSESFAGTLVMSWHVGIGSLGRTVFFQVGLCTPLRTMSFIQSIMSYDFFETHLICHCSYCYILIIRPSKKVFLASLSARKRQKTLDAKIFQSIIKVYLILHIHFSTTRINYNLDLCIF